MYTKLISFIDNSVMEDQGFKYEYDNMLSIDGKLFSVGYLPNQLKTSIVDGKLPDVIVIPDYNTSGINLCGIFFVAAVVSSRNAEPVELVVKDQQMKQRMIDYLSEGFRPDVMDRITDLGIHASDVSSLKTEYDYFNQFERDVSKLVTVKTFVESDFDIQAQDGVFQINEHEIDLSDIHPITFSISEKKAAIVQSWQPTFGVLITGSTSGTYDKAPATNMIVRYKDWGENQSMWIDCGPGMMDIAAKGGESIEKVNVVITHGHEDHDVGIWDLLLSDDCKQVNIYTHAVYADSFWKKAESLNLLDLAEKKVNIVDITPNDGRKSQLVNGLSITTEWAVHGIPTISIKVEHQGKKVIYTSDTAVSAERLNLLEEANVISMQRKQKIMDFFSEESVDLFIEEMGAFLEDGSHKGGPNHNNNLETPKPEKIEVHKVVHWSGANMDQIPQAVRAKLFDRIELIP